METTFEAFLAKTIVQALKEHAAELNLDTNNFVKVSSNNLLEVNLVEKIISGKLHSIDEVTDAMTVEAFSEENEGNLNEAKFIYKGIYYLREISKLVNRYNDIMTK